MWLFLPQPEPPGFDELPVDVNGVVEVQEQALAAIQKAQAEEIVVGKRRGRIQDRISYESGKRLADAPRWWSSLAISEL